jgi:hypothetical protein
VVSTPLKNVKVNWDHYSQYMESKKTKNKPPTSKPIENIYFYIPKDLNIRNHQKDTVEPYVQDASSMMCSPYFPGVQFVYLFGGCDK